MVVDAEALDPDEVLLELERGRVGVEGRQHVDAERKVASEVTRAVALKAFGRCRMNSSMTRAPSAGRKVSKVSAREAYLFGETEFHCPTPSPSAP